MGLPGFTAASSLYATVGHYASLSRYSDSIHDVVGRPPRFSPCDTIGQRCCGPDGQVNTQHCHKGLGCNVATDRCEACGAPGQVCCDGDFTGFSLKGYSAFLRDPAERTEACNASARCDAQLAPDRLSWLGTRRCGTCGNKVGGACCAPDTSYGLGRCFTDDRSGVRMACADPWAGSASTCIYCGGLNQPVCIDRRRCDVDWLVDLNGTCVLCGRVGQPPCNLTGCDDYTAIVDWKHDICIAAGGRDQPCRSDGTCNFEGSYCDKKICKDCGWGWSKGYPMACCPGGKCVEGECNKYNLCVCGYEGQVPCRNGCMPGFVDKWGECVKGAPPPPPPPPPSQWKTCSGENWGLSTQDRTVYLQNASTKCLTSVTYKANSVQEAYTCAKRDHGDAVVTQAVNSYTFGLTSQFGCNPVTLSAPDEDDAQTCAQSQCINCWVTPGGCF
jgi:hypothetical protein